MARNLLCVMIFGVGSQVGAAAAPPNVVFFLIDDLGWTDLGYMYDHLGETQQFYESPNIDRLASQSVVLTHAYSAGPNCAPSRASILTGCYTPRHGIFTVGDPRRGNHRSRKLEPIENETVLASRFKTLPELLQAAGYKTASMGKWHLGDDPRRHGFDVNVAGKQWGSPSGGGYHSPLAYPNLTVQTPGVYLTDALTDRALAFIEENQSRPFFLYLSHYAVHTPIESKATYAERFRKKAESTHHRNAEYAGMIQSVDESVGRVLAKVEALGLTKNTVVIFYSDNGGHSGATSNHPLRGAKGMLYEGGIRVPLLVKWPGEAEPRKCTVPVSGIDLLPTITEIAGCDAGGLPEVDGLSWVPLLKGDAKVLDRDSLYWHFPAYLQGKGDPGGGPFRTTPACAIRMGNWKLIEWFETGHRELYDLAVDQSETRDLAAVHPDKRDELHLRLRQWREAVSAPVPTQPNPRYRP